MVFYSAKLWWQFAIQTQLEGIRKTNVRRSWKFAATRVRQVLTYCSAYRRRIEPISEPTTPQEGGAASPNNGSPTQPLKKKSKREADSALIKQIERDPEYTYEDLHILR